MGTAGLLWVHSCNAIFHFCTLEEYYVGGMFMGIGNAITDGSFLYYLVMLVLTIFGNDFMVVEAYAKDHFYEGSPQIQVIHLILTFVISVTTGTIIGTIRNIFKHKRLVAAKKEGKI